ncbi:MAG: hypothetical protein ACKO7W_03580 [Elainella sp.]
MVRGQVNQSSAFDANPQRRRQRHTPAPVSRLDPGSIPPNQSDVRPASPESTLPEASLKAPGSETDELVQAAPAQPALTQPAPAYPDIKPAAAAKPSSKALFTRLRRIGLGASHQWLQQPWPRTVALLRALPQKTGSWPLFCLAVLGLFGSTSLLAYFWLAGLPPLPDCDNTTPLSPDSHRLYCAQEAARSGQLEDLVAGINLVKNWSPNHSLYGDAQQSLAQWSRQMMLVARDRMNQNDFKGASAALSQIPANSPVYEEAQKTLAAWSKQWQSGESLYNKAVEAMNRQDWRAAFDQVTELGYLDHDYWRVQQADSLAKQISIQKGAQDSLKQAKKLSTKLGPAQMGEAILLLQSIPPQAQAWPEAQTLMTTWSQDLLKVAWLYWQDGYTARAIELAQEVPLSLTLEANLADLVKYSHAVKLVEDNQIEERPWRQLWSLVEATTALEQIGADSPLYSQAQAQLQGWQARLQDLQQIQLATMVASLGQKPALDYAIAQAEQMGTDRPLYGQAQSRVANWKLQTEQLQDLPYLKLAQQFAAGEIGQIATAGQPIAQLQLAIAQAQVIPQQRSLWSEAQAQIVAWQRQIEKLEDQPMLDEAVNLAKANKLDEAITAAAQIRPNRALYDQAQAAISSWKEKIRLALLAEDQAVLDRAYGLAGSGDLTGGIATAAQLSPGRPLHLEAQSAIGAWLRERDGDPKAPVDPVGDAVAPESASSSTAPEAGTESAASGDSTADAGSSSEGSSGEIP